MNNYEQNIFEETYGTLLNKNWDDAVINNQSNFVDVFKSIDLDDNGLITSDELQSTLLNKGFNNSPIENVPDVLKLISKDGNDAITYNEFKSVFKNN